MPTIKEALAAKIASKDEFDKALIAVHRRNADSIGTAQKMSDDGRTKVAVKRDYPRAIAIRNEAGYAAGDVLRLEGQLQAPYHGAFTSPTGVSCNTFDYTRWWALREQLRLLWGVYDRADTLLQINLRFPELGIHCRADEQDPAVVFYTPDAQAGERDAQVRTTLGRLVRKLYPHTTDEDIRNLEAAHRADRSDEVEFLTGDALVAGYENGVGSCMGKDRSVWKDYGLDNHHPVEAFCAEGFALAVGRDGGGKINARTITWVNPSDEKDKRWLRLYGDSALIRRLEKRGYRCAGLNGTRLKRIDLKMGQHGNASSQVRVVMPFLDAPGADDSKPENGRYAVLDGDHMLVVNDKSPVWKALRVKGISPAACTPTSGFVLVDKRATADAIYETCPLSGQKFDASKAKVFVWVDGKPRGVHPDQVKAAETAFPLTGYVHFNGAPMLVRGKSDTPIFNYTGTQYIEDDTTRHALGFIQLSKKFYPNDRWHRGTFKVAVMCNAETGEETGENIKSGDSVQAVFAHNPQGWNWTHTSVVEDKDWVKVHRLDTDHPLYVQKGVPTEKTASGRTVVPGVHEVRKRADGVWDFTRNMSCEYHYNTEIWIARGESATEDQIIASASERMVEAVQTRARLQAASSNTRRGLSNDAHVAAERAYGYGTWARDHIGALPVKAGPNDNRVAFLTGSSSTRREAGQDNGWGDLLTKMMAFAEPIMAGTATMPQAHPSYEYMQDRPMVALKLAYATWKAYQEAFDAKIAELRAAPQPAPVAANTVRFIIAA